jgi:hypothetical protein
VSNFCYLLGRSKKLESSGAPWASQGLGTWSEQVVGAGQTVVWCVVRDKWSGFSMGQPARRNTGTPTPAFSLGQLFPEPGAGGHYSWGGTWSKCPSHGSIGHPGWKAEQEDGAYHWTHLAPESGGGEAGPLRVLDLPQV